MLTLAERAAAYNAAFPAFAARSPLAATGDYIAGVWMIGNDYRNAAGYYGEYPPSYLDRVASLFPDIPPPERLHLFSGSVPAGAGDRVDINPATSPTYVGDAERLSEVVPRAYWLILADPPYSAEDAVHYGVPLVNRNLVVAECAKVLEPGGFLVWLDQVFPIHRADEFRLVGHIGLIRSTNHRVRMVFIWERRGERRGGPRGGSRQASIRDFF